MTPNAYYNNTHSGREKHHSLPGSCNGGSNHRCQYFSRHACKYERHHWWSVSSVWASAGESTASSNRWNGGKSNNNESQCSDRGWYWLRGIRGGRHDDGVPQWHSCTFKRRNTPRQITNNKRITGQILTPWKIKKRKNKSLQPST